MALARHLVSDVSVRGCVQSTKTSFSTVVEIVGNAVVCALVTCVANYIWSIGNFFSGKSAAHQSRVSFLAAALGTSHLISGAMTVVAQAHVLCSFRFVTRPTQPPSVMFCIRTLLRASWIAFVVTELLMVASVYVASLGPPALRAYKVEFYLACFTGHAITTAVATNTRRIIKTQTVQGQQAAQRRRERERAVATAMTGPSNGDDTAQTSSPTVRTLSVSKRLATFVWRSTAQVVQFSKTYVRSYQGELPVILSGLYVHLTIHLGIPTDAMGLVVFAVVSLVLKVVAQEAAKVMLTKKKVGDIRTMCVAIGLPPILIDTQIRIVLQYAQSTTVAVTGILGLGIVEIAMRVAKLLWLKSQIRRHRRRARAPGNSIVPVKSIISSDPSLKGSDSTNKPHPPSPAPTSIDSDAWERRLWQLHTAELYTDMSAEYMAISCSTCFLYFFGSHPKYMLERTLSSLASGTSSSASTPSSSMLSGWSTHVSSSMALQLMVEVIVDLCACVVEISAGTDFAQLQQYRYFVVSFLANLAVANLQIAGVMYFILASSS